MENVVDIFRKHFSQKKLSKTIAIYTILAYIKNEFSADIKGYLKNWVLYLKIKNPYVSMKIFLSKKQLINQLNEKLKKMGYSFKIQDIRKI